MTMFRELQFLVYTGIARARPSVLQIENMGANVDIL